MYFKSCIKLIIYYNNFEFENMEQVNEICIDETTNYTNLETTSLDNYLHMKYVPII